VICRERNKSLEGLLEESCREDKWDIFQVDQLAFLDICRGRTLDLSEGHTSDTKGHTHCAEFVYFWVVFVILRSIWLGEGRTYFQGEIAGVSLSLLARSICIVRYLYIFCCIIKIHKLKNMFSHIRLFSGLFAQKYLCLSWLWLLLYSSLLIRFIFLLCILKFCEET